MRQSATAVAARLTTAAQWAIGLGPAFFATVVLDRAQTARNVPGWDFTRLQAPTAPWRVQVGEIYTAGTIALLIGVLISCRATPRLSTNTAGAAVVATGVGMYAGPVLSALFGGHGGVLDWRLYLAPLAIVALYVTPPIPPVRLLRRLRAMLRVYTWGSLCALAVAPDWALTSSNIVNFRLPRVGASRLVGLTDHPVLLGVLAAATLVVELAPLNRTRLWPLHSGVAAAVLLLAQSRTAWMAAPLGVLLLYRRGPSNRVHPLLARGLALGIVICGATLVPTLMDRMGGIMSDREVTSLHGRTYVWDLAMSAFRSNILWGYGPTFFKDRSSPVHGAFAHAHSQLYQTLATSGLMGAVGLLLFVAALVVAAARTGRVSAGLSWSLVAVTLTTCATEAPLRGLDFSPFLVLVLLDIAVLLTMSRSLEAEPGSTAVHPFPKPPVYGRSSRSAANTSAAAGWLSSSRFGSAG